MGGPNVGGGGGGICICMKNGDGGGGGGGCGSGFGAGGEMMIILDPLSDFRACDGSNPVTTRMRINRQTIERDMSATEWRRNF